MPHDAIKEDLAQHYAHQLRQLLVDSGDTFEHADMDLVEIAGYLIAGMLREAALGAMSLALNEREYADLCITAYREMRQGLTPEKRDRLTRLSTRPKRGSSTTETSDDQGTERQPRRPPRR